MDSVPGQAAVGTIFASRTVPSKKGPDYFGRGVVFDRPNLGVDVELPPVPPLPPIPERLLTPPAPPTGDSP